MEEKLFEFDSKLTIVGMKYSTHADVFADKVVISREGITGDLPKECTVFFSDVSGVTYTKSMRPWITFTVSGAVNVPSFVTAVPAGKIVLNGSTQQIPYHDAYSIVGGVTDGDRFAGYAEKIKAIFSDYKSSHPAGGTTVQAAEDNALDKLKKLKELHDMGILTDAEFEEKKQKLLAEI